MSDADLGAFLRGLHGGALATGVQLSQRPGFAAFKSLLDVGGGLRVSIAARNAIPCLSAIIVELPRIAALLGLLMPCFQVVSESRRMMS